MIVKGGKLVNQACHPGLYITGTSRHVKRRRQAACLFACFFLFRKPSFIHDTQFSIDLCPVLDGSSPFFRSFKSRLLTELYHLKICFSGGSASDIWNFYRFLVKLEGKTLRLCPLKSIQAFTNEGFASTVSAISSRTSLILEII